MQVLQNILLRPKTAMSSQQLRQLTAETKRLFLRHLLVKAKGYLVDHPDAYRRELEYGIKTERKKLADGQGRGTATEESLGEEVFHSVFCLNVIIRGKKYVDTLFYQ